MAGINKVILVGHLGKDPEVQSFENGVKKATFSLATTESYKGKDGNRVDQTEWHNIVLWRGLAEVSEKYLKKGHQIYIEGKIKTESWDDKEGNKKYKTTIVGDNMTMLSKGKENAGGSSSEVENPSIEGPEDDLPF